MANTYYDSQLTAAEIEAALEAIDGILSPANNGKVLAISNGKFEARSVQWGGGGNYQSKTVTPSATQQTVEPDSGYDALSSVIINGDEDLVAGNIKKDVEIFGVTGSYEGSGGSTPKLYTDVEPQYYMTYAGLICTLNYRAYNKIYADPAIVAYYHRSDENFTTPILLSTTQNGVVFGTSYDASQFSYKGTIEYNGITYYYNGISYNMDGNRTSTAGFAEKLPSDYATLESAAEALAELALGYKFINTNGAYLIPSGYDGFGNIEVSIPNEYGVIYAGTAIPSNSLGNNNDIYKKWKNLLGCDPAYYVESTSQLLSTQSTAFYKTVAGPAIGVHYYDGVYYGPLLISTVADYVKLTANTDSVYSAVIDGTTWYLSTSNYWNSSSDTPSIPTLYTLRLPVTSANAESIIRAILTDASLFSIFDTYKKVNGSWDLVDPVLQEKTATENGYVYPDSGYDGLSRVFVNVSSGGNIIGIYPDYIVFPGSPNYIDTQIMLNSDHKVTVVFDATDYFANQAVVGSGGGPSRFHLTQYNGRWYASNGSGEINFDRPTTGKHTFVFGDNGYNYFDNEQVSTCTPQTVSNISYYLGYRSSATNFIGKMYEFKIESISSGAVLYDLKPFAVIDRNSNTVVVGMYDSANNNKYFVLLNATYGFDS